MDIETQLPPQIMVINTSVIDFDSLSLAAALTSCNRIINATDECTILQVSLSSQPLVLKCVKTSRNGGSKSDDDIDRELCALQLLCTTMSPHIMHYHGYERKPEVVTMVLGYVEGPTLRDWILCPRGDNFSETTMPVLPQDSWMLRKSILSGIATGVKAIHELNCAHNDLNPSNIVLSLPNLIPILVDVGIATLPVYGLSNSGRSSAAKLGSKTRIFRTGVLSKGCTPAYTALERFQSFETGFKSDQVSDLYSIGVMSLELFTGELIQPSNHIPSAIEAEERRLKMLNFPELSPVMEKGGSESDDEEERIIPCTQLQELDIESMLKMLSFIQKCVHNRRKRYKNVDEVLFSININFPPGETNNCPTEVTTLVKSDEAPTSKRARR